MRPTGRRRARRRGCSGRWRAPSGHRPCGCRATPATMVKSTVRMARSGIAGKIELDVGEIGEAGRRLDLQAAAVADVDRLDDEARRQRGDDRRDAQRPDQQVVGGADRRRRWPSAAARPSGDHRVAAVHHLHGDGAGEPDIGGQRQVDIARAERDDEHLADADDDGEDGERQRRGDHAAGAVAAGEDDRGEPDDDGADEGPDPGLGEQAAKRAHAALPPADQRRARRAR